MECTETKQGGLPFLAVANVWVRFQASIL